jgi:hypothetical protein
VSCRTSSALARTKPRLTLDFFHAETFECQVNNLLITPRRHPVDEMIQGGLGHGVRRLQQRVTRKLRFAPRVGVAHPRFAQRGLLAGDGHITLLMAEPELTRDQASAYPARRIAA